MNIKCKTNNKRMSAKRRAINANCRRRVMAANNGNASVSKIKKFIEDSVNSLQTSDYTNSRLILDDDLCLYVGYASGFDTKDGYAICAKIAERNDADWADFDYLNMPWNTYSDNDGSTGVFEGDVYDTDIEITPGEDYTKDAQWLADSYTEIRNLLDEGKLTINSSCGKKSIKSSRRKTVRAAYEERRSFDAYGYNEDGDLEFEGLPYALDSIDEVTAWLKAMLDGVEEFKSQWTEWGGSTSELEMFSGPDDAENFGAEMYSNIVQNGLEPIANKLGDMLGVYIYP